MQDKKEETSQAIHDLSQVFKFELWLRFYFIQEKEEKLVLNLDDQILQKIRENYGHLAELAQELNQKEELTPEICRKAIVDHIQHQFDGHKYQAGLVPQILDHSIFNTEIQLFNTWASLHEDQLDQKVLDFEKWLELFNEWKQSDSAQKVAQSIKMEEQQQHPGSQKIH